MKPDEVFDSECAECNELLDQLSEYLDGGLNEQLRQEVILHAHECSHCGRLLFSLRQVVSFCQTTPSCDMPEAVREQLRLVIRREMESDSDSATS